MRRLCEALTLIALSVLGSCANEERLATTGSMASRQPAGINGQDVYEELCSSCHRAGVGGAPVTGDRDAWAGRSPLWMAVLSAHANEGYLQMPPRGGDPNLTEAQVQAATEYMLLQAFPERPSD
ncbi:MAG TPA: c-type cytochrome [Gammaproteobacteria bacterium]